MSAHRIHVRGCGINQTSVITTGDLLNLEWPDGGAIQIYVDPNTIHVDLLPPRATVVLPEQVPQVVTLTRAGSRAIAASHEELS